MKYGEHFEKESVPQWSLYNIDYNSLKHHIKAHTTKDQATAIAIPGRPDTALAKFEDDLYSELCRQHSRVDLFVTSKADELARRLQHLSNQIHRLILRCATSGRDAMSLKRQQRFAKYEQVLLQCGDDIRSLQRFVNAQVVAFRKILKKYRKWTGSSTLGSRFRDNVLAHPKSFTRRDFSRLQSQYNDLLETLRAALGANPDRAVSPSAEPSRPRAPSALLSPSETIVAPESQPVSGGYWNEYDYGSEAGDLDRTGDAEYAIYINPNEDVSFPGMKALGAFFAKPLKKLNAYMFFRRQDHATPPERDPLVHTHLSSTYGSATTRSPAEPSYFSSPPGGTVLPPAALDTDDLEDGSTSSPFASARHSRRDSRSHQATDYYYSPSSSPDDRIFSFPPGYRAHYAAALPSVDAQRAARYRERALCWGTWGGFAAAAALAGVAAVLIVAGRHRMRLEVDAGVTVGIMASLGLACAGLCMTCARADRLAVWHRLAVWAAFAAVCVVNGVLLVLVVGHARL